MDKWLKEHIEQELIFGELKKLNNDWLSEYNNAKESATGVWIDTVELGKALRKVILKYEANRT